MTERVPLPETGRSDVRVPCEWCGREEVVYSRPPATAMLWTDHGMPQWRICETCIKLFTDFINWRKTAH